jgi:dihydroorotate dehydrogenase/Pyruvate/2-oxoacid:ferredoxin oxidoreductase delta subunit
MNVHWMGYKLTSPIVLASLTPISHSRIEEHTQFIKSAFECGAGAVVLGSIYPSYVGCSDFNYTQNDLICINSGLYENLAHESMMAISLIGPPYPNLASVEYGINLIKNVRVAIKNGTIIGSIINFGSIDEITKIAIRLIENGADGIELNLSCPNIINSNSKITMTDVNSELIYKIHEVTEKPISLKLSPIINYDNIFSNENLMSKISGITVNNAYLGLVPPDINSTKSPFKRSDYWSPSGIYGPFERMLTYYSLYSIQQKTKQYNIDISCVGGLVDGKHVIEAILLGACTIQLSSGVLWKSTKLIESSNAILKKYMEDNNYNSVETFKGKSLEYILDSVVDINEYKSDGERLSYQMPTPHVLYDKCTGCSVCINSSCLALSFDNITRKANINEDLCSGCGFCIQKCINSAIIR